MLLTRGLFVLALLGVAWPAQAQYDFRLVDLPFTAVGNPVIMSVVQGAIRGAYEDVRSQTHSFLETCAGDIHVVPNLTTRASSTTAQAGSYIARTGRTTGWVLQDGTFTVLEGARDANGKNPVSTEALDVNDAGVVVGSSRSVDGHDHGFRFTPAPELLETLDAPDAVDTILLRISNEGHILARATATDGTVSYLLLVGDTWTTLTLPVLPNLELVGRLADGRLVGNTDSTGFVFDGTTVTFISHGGSTLTQLFGNDDAGRVYGRVVIDDVSRGFVAVPTGTPDPCDAARKDKPEQPKHPRRR